MPTENQETKRLLFASNLFPDRDEPVRGLDNATLLHALAREWSIRVISPRPVFPPWKSVTSLCREEDLPFEPVFVPAPYLPKIGDRWNDSLMARALSPGFRKAVEAFNPQAVVASWLYPDGSAIATLAESLDLPAVLITQGTDTHRYLDYPVRRRRILSAIERSAAVVCRSRDLARRLEAAGADPDKLITIYNGVNPDVFRRRDKETTCRELGLNPGEPILLFVGNYLPVKDPAFLIRAHAELNRRRSESGASPARLVMIGDGPLRKSMEAEIATMNTNRWVDLKPRMAPSAIARWMNAANLLCLTSRNEGFPNVILEALASGLPVVSTDVGGIGELLDNRIRGQLVSQGNLSGYVDALECGIHRAETPDSADRGTLSRLSDPSWERAAREYSQLIESIL